MVNLVTDAVLLFIKALATSFETHSLYKASSERPRGGTIQLKLLKDVPQLILCAT